MKTYVVNLLGGSGLGKSTTAALVFGELKQRGELAELVREFVKEWAWSGKKVGPFGQSIIYGQQLDRESALYNKVEFVVTDSPLLLCPVYQKHYSDDESIKHCVLRDLKTSSEMDVVHVNFLLKRNKPFDPRGRYEDEDTAKHIDRKIQSFLEYEGIDYITVDGPSELRVKFITDAIISIRNRGV